MADKEIAGHRMYLKLRCPEPTRYAKEENQTEQIKAGGVKGCHEMKRHLKGWGKLLQGY